MAETGLPRPVLTPSVGATPAGLIPPSLQAPASISSPVLGNSSASGAPPASGQPQAVFYSTPKNNDHVLLIATVTLVISAVVCLLTFGVTVNKKNNLIGLNETIAGLNIKLATPRLSQTATRLNQIAEKLTIFQGAQNRPYLGRALTAVSARVPKTVQLTTLSIDQTSSTVKVDAKTKTLKDIAYFYLALRDYQEVELTQTKTPHLLSSSDLAFIKQSFTATNIQDATASLMLGCKAIIRYSKPTDSTLAPGSNIVLTSNLNQAGYTLGTPRPVFSGVTFANVSPPSTDTQSGASGQTTSASTSSAVSFTVTPSKSLFELPPLSQSDYCSGQSAVPSASSSPATNSLPTSSGLVAP